MKPINYIEDLCRHTTTRVEDFQRVKQAKPVRNDLYDLLNQMVVVQSITIQYPEQNVPLR